jgi:hypothetical protein
MRLSQYIATLEALRQEHGDLEVEKWMPAKGRHEAPDPVLAFRRRFATTRDTQAGGVGSFYQPDHDNLTQKGDPVVRV